MKYDACLLLNKADNSLIKLYIANYYHPCMYVVIVS